MRTADIHAAARAAASEQRVARDAKIAEGRALLGKLEIEGARISASGLLLVVGIDAVLALLARVSVAASPGAVEPPSSPDGVSGVSTVSGPENGGAR